MQNVASGSSFLSDYRELGDVLYVEVTDDFHYRRALGALTIITNETPVLSTHSSEM